MFTEKPRKVHLYHDQEGATFGTKNTPFANTLCKMNSDVPDSHITTDHDKVTCKICRRDARFAQQDHKPAPSAGLFVQQVGRGLRPGWINGKRTRFRRNWRGKLILQVEVTKHYMKDLNGSGFYDEWDVTSWRDATLEDLGLGVA